MAHSASFCRRHFTAGIRFNVALLAGLALAPSALLMVGCDSDAGKASKKVTEQLDQAVTDGDPQSANKALAQAAADKAAGKPEQLRAQALLGDSELQLAHDLDLQVLANDSQIARLTREIGLLSSTIAANNSLIAGMAKNEPTSIQAAVAQRKSEVTGSDDKPDWVKSDANTLASLSASDKQAATLTASITALTDTIKTESDQRNQLLEQADKLTQQSQHASVGNAAAKPTAQQSVDLYVQGSNARKQAADLTVKIDTDTATLEQTKADLGVLQGHRESLSSTLASLDKQSSVFSADWKLVQEAQASLSAESKKLLGEEPVKPPVTNAKTGIVPTDATIGSKASAILGLAKLNHDLRDGALAHFNSAIGFYSNAYDLATQIKQSLAEKSSKGNADEKPDKIAWDAMAEALDPSTYRYLQADAQLQKAEFFARSASEAKVRLDQMDAIKPVLQAAQLTAYPSLEDGTGMIADQLRKSQASARDSFKDATDNLSKIYDGAGLPEHKNAAQVQEIFAQYAWYVLELSAGDTQKAAEHLSAAKTAVAAAADAGPLPALPAELVPATKAAAPGAPATPGAPAAPMVAPPR